jgi:pimeloyl-ACP methyl ester carboxylesterase
MFGCQRGPASWRDPSSHRAQLVTVDKDVQLEVLDWGGTGPPVVLLAGLENTAHIYDEFAPKLVPEYHVYGITRRGYGASSKPVAGYAADRLGDEVLAAIDILALKRPVLVGHSVGGEELSSIGSRHPQRIAALIYLDAAYKQAYDPAWITGEPPIPSPSANAPPQPPAMTAEDMATFQSLRAWCMHFSGFSPSEAELRQEFELTPDGHVGKARTPPSVEKAILAGTQHYTDIRASALAIYAVPHDQGPWVNDDPVVRAAADAAAARDMMSTGAQADAFERGVPGARVVRLAHANHYVFMSNEADVLREMRAFLSNAQ